MNKLGYLTQLLPKIVLYRASRSGLLRSGNPITLTYSVTAACQSKCKTCNIGTRYCANPEVARQDLSIAEIERVFRNLGHIYFLNISGGEPFLRSDLSTIIQLACRYLSPVVVHIPTNALIPERIAKTTRKILQIMDRAHTDAPLTIKPSIDGIGQLHDYIRGVKGNFEKLEHTVRLLLEIRERNQRLHVELGTVVSRFNIDRLDEIEDYVHNLGVESYRNEIAEQREEFFNIDEPITPTANEYQKLMVRFSNKIRENVSKKLKFTQVTEAMRLVYYDLAVKILKERAQVVPCYAGISNVHLNYDGELWPCCVLGYRKPMGNLRPAAYDFKRVFYSKQANQVRRYIRNGGCHCPLANQAYSNMLMSLRYFARIFAEYLKCIYV